MAHYAEEHEKAQHNPTEYLANPINAYLLVKRLTSDWKSTESLLKNDLYQGKFNFFMYLNFFLNFRFSNFAKNFPKSLTELS